MKKILSILMLSLCLLAGGQTYDTSRSYVSERIYLNKEGTRYVDNVTYLDGFGRKSQEIQVKGSPFGGADLVVPHAYGALGHKEKEYLPFAKVENNGAFISNAYASGNWAAAYGSTDASYAFVKTEYDNSPLDRVVRRTGAGASWHTAGKGVRPTP